MNLGPWELIILLFLLAFIAIPVWALIDAARISDSRWAAAGQQRTLWLALIGFGTLCGGFVGTVLAIVYLVSIRPKLLVTGASGP